MQDREAIYKEVVQSVLLYSSNIWVVMGYMVKVLKGFHHRLARRIMGLTAKCVAGGEWGYLLVV